MTLDSWFRRLEAAGRPPPEADPRSTDPESDRERRKRKVRALKNAGVSSRKARDLAGEPGFSSSNYSKQQTDEGKELLEQLQGRRFDLPGEPPIVAAHLDATKIGPPDQRGTAEKKKRAVMIVVGITADGRKVGLGAAMTPWESKDDIYPLLRGIVERGVDPGILWVADHGAGIEAALKRLAHPEPPLVQICTTHAAGNMKKALPDEMPIETKEEWAKKLYGAWLKDDADAALAKLTAVAAELDELGFASAAGSLRKNMDGTVTVQRLGLTGKLRQQLRSTNSQESINRSVKEGTHKDTRWTDERRLRAVAWGLSLLERDRGWSRLAEPEQLLALAEQIYPGGYDREAILAKLPPNLSVAKLPISFADDERMLAIATRWIGEHPNAAWVGSPGTLGALGLDGDGEPTPETLVGAMRTRNPEGATLRPRSQVSFARPGADGILVEEKVDGIIDLEWELRASPTAMGAWRDGGEARERVEASLTEAAAAAVERVTLTTNPHHGFAGVMALRRPSEEEPDRPVSIAGITFAVQRGREAKLRSPATEEMLESRTARAAEDAAKEVLDERLGEAERSASGRDGAGADPSPALMAGVEARALELAPRMVAAEPEELEALAGSLAEAREGLRPVAGEVGDWWEESRQEAALQIVAARLRSHHSARPRGDVEWPLDPGQRLALGEVRTQQLLDAAAMLEGVAEGDAEAARELGEAAADPLAALKRPVDRVDAAAEALAARGELERRRQLQAAREGTGRAPPPPELRDSRGEPTADPIDRFGPALGPDRAARLERYARAVAPELRELGDPALRRLAAAGAGAWAQLNPTAGVRLAGLERGHDALLAERLRALRHLGSEAAAEVRAELTGDASTLLDAQDRAAGARDRAQACAEQLRELGAQVAEQRQAAGSPESLLRDRSEAAIHHAAYAELARRERERELLSMGRGGGEAPQLNRSGMATAEQSESASRAEDGLMPAFEARRMVVVPGEPDATAGLPPAGDGNWLWIGDEEVLGRFGVGRADEVEQLAFDRVARGRHAARHDPALRLRAANTVKHEGQRVQGLVQVEGSYLAPADIAERWRTAELKEKPRIRHELVAEAEAGIALLAGTDSFAAAATFSTVGEGAEETPRVDWVALGADRGEGLSCPYDTRRVKDIGAFAEKATRHLRDRLAAAEPEAKARHDLAGTPARSAEEEPSASIPELPSAPLRDSLATYREVLGDETAREIKVQADAARSEFDLGRLSEQQLRQALPETNPFDRVPHGPGAFSAWPQGHANAVMRTTAIEGQLIDNAREAYSALAERESARRGERTSNPMAVVREARGGEFASKVERRAAVLASHLDSMPEARRRQLTASLRAEIEADGGHGKARFETISQAVALQHGRNAGNELEAQRLEQAAAEIGVAHESVPEVGYEPV